MRARDLGALKPVYYWGFPFNQNFRKLGNSGKWYTSFPEIFPEIPETVKISEMRTIQPKILEIPVANMKGKRTAREKLFENLGIPREVVHCFGNCGKRCSICYWKLPETQRGRFG